MKKEKKIISGHRHPTKASYAKWNDLLNKATANGVWRAAEDLPIEAALTRYSADGYSFNLIERRFLGGHQKAVVTYTSSQEAIHKSGARGISLVISDAHMVFEQYNKRYDVAPGDIMLINRHKPFSVSSDTNRLKVTTLIIKETILRSWIPPHIFEYTQVIEGNGYWAKSLALILSGINEEFLDCVPYPSRFIRMICCLLSLHFKHHVGLSTYKSSLLARMKQIITVRYADSGFSASVLAKEVGMSVRGVHAVFKEADKSFLQELTGVRIASAKKMLESQKTSKVSVATVAKKVGFSSLSYFSTSFKRGVGVSPHEYVKKCRTAAR